MLTLSQAMGLDDRPQKRIEVTPELARSILSQPDNLSIKKIAAICGCTSDHVRAVFDKEKQWKELLRFPGNK